MYKGYMLRQSEIHSGNTRSVVGSSNTNARPSLGKLIRKMEALIFDGLKCCMIEKFTPYLRPWLKGEWNTFIM